MAAIVGKEARCRPQYIGRVPSTSRRTAHSVRVEENMGSSFSEVSLVVFSLLCSSSKPELSSKNPDAESSLGMDLVSPFSSFCHYYANILKEESSLKNLGPEGESSLGIDIVSPFSSFFHYYTHIFLDQRHA